MKHVYSLGVGNKQPSIVSDHSSGFRVEKEEHETSVAPASRIPLSDTADHYSNIPTAIEKPILLHTSIPGNPDRDVANLASSALVQREASGKGNARSHSFSFYSIHWQRIGATIAASLARPKVRIICRMHARCPVKASPRRLPYSPGS